ncbi:Solute carrier family 2, facilitated glucose transporter member 5 [Varanus komodoensis]|nr:Solute carrier family 2, facilitated glucose transporter member 5 [Varanus komodoensis]
MDGFHQFRRDEQGGHSRTFWKAFRVAISRRERDAQPGPSDMGSHNRQTKSGVELAAQHGQLEKPSSVSCPENIGSSLKDAETQKARRKRLSSATYTQSFRSSIRSIDATVIMKEKSGRRALTRPLVMVTLVTSFGSSLQYGYNLWVVNHPAALIQDFYNNTYHQRKKVYIEATFLSFLYSMTVAIFSLGGLIGSLLSGPMVDKCGRKGTLFLNNLLAIISSILMGFSTLVHAYEYTIFSRLITGVCSGIFSCAVPLYLAEVAPRNLRGTMVSVSALFIVIGVLISQVLGYEELLGTKKYWPILLSLPGFLAVLQVIVLPSCPESPRYLMIQERDEEKARQTLKKLRGQEDVEQEIDELYLEHISEKAEKEMGGLKLLFYRGLRWQVISVVVLMSGHQLTGVSAVYYYADNIYASMFLSKKEIRYIVLFSVISLVITLMVVVYIIDTVGRRALILIGFGVCSIICVLLTMALEMQTTISWMSYASSSLVFLFLIAHVLGPGPVPILLTTELFLQSTRSTSVALGGFVHWLVNFLMGIIFLHIETLIGSYSFLLFWPLSVATFIYIFKYIPETKGRTFLEIKRLMSAQLARRIQVQGHPAKENLKKRAYPPGGAS